MINKILRVKPEYQELSYKYEKELENLVDTFLEMKHRKTEVKEKRDSHFLKQKARVQELGFTVYQDERGYYRIYKTIRGKKTYIHLGKDLKNAELKIISRLHALEKQGLEADNKNISKNN